MLVSDENEELADIEFRGELEPESLSRVELEKLILFTAYRMGGWESTFVHYDEGLLGERNWQLWDAARLGHDRRFQDHVDRVFEQAPETQSGWLWPYLAGGMEPNRSAAMPLEAANRLI